MRLLWLALLCALVACSGTRPSAPAQVPIWPGAAPDAQPVPGPENATTTETEPLVAGRPWTQVTNVARPTMTVYPPRGANTRAAIVVFPGGGYKALAVDLEGTEVCDWLTSRGITCVLLKYRVPYTGPYGLASCQCHITPKVPRALEDAQRTISLVRARAAELHIDPHKIGVLGFSAGGHLVAAASTHFAERAYPAIDAIDRESCRPDFAIALYPGHLWTEENLDLNPDIATRISRDTPPTFHPEARDIVERIDGEVLDAIGRLWYLGKGWPDPRRSAAKHRWSKSKTGARARWFRGLKRSPVSGRTFTVSVIASSKPSISTASPRGAIAEKPSSISCHLYRVARRIQEPFGSTEPEKPPSNSSTSATASASSSSGRRFGSDTRAASSALHAARASMHELAQRIVSVPRGETERASAKVGRNDPCPCGFGKKYKKCCAAA
ncbi:alpha/beta hydrolase fold domain-containing protein [Pendulispora albinea]|uniref:Alpha/beta hydrolase fold domain-containing protein n=1 Tax=Pendulispora albinea TaxID=2741071 RepID=A0ABZ2LMS9_9BACT